jgi:hypothetical protein
MRCRVITTTSWDRAFLIKREEFMSCVDADDFACRESHAVEDYYRADWFYFELEGPFFNPPAFYLKNGLAFFINGRHRTVLLARHFPLFPMALTQIDNASETTLARITAQPLADRAPIVLPDLPIVGLSACDHDA